MADKNFKVKKNIQVTDLAVAGPVTVDSSGVLASSSALAVNLGGTGQTSASAAFDALLPTQTNNANKLLGTDGTSASWVSPGIAYQTSAPDNPVTGQLWVDSDETGDSLDPYIIRRKTITATAGQTVFTTDVVFTDGYEQIYYNGVLLVRTTDYTTSGGTNTVTLLQGASAGDTVEIISSTPINLINSATLSINTFTGTQTIANSGEWPVRIVSTGSTSSNRAHFISQRSNNGGSVTSGFTLGGLSMSGHDGTNYGLGWNGGAEITAYAAENWTSSARGTHLSFLNTGNGTTTITERMRIHSNGNVSIGSSSVGQKLSVNGSMDVVHEDGAGMGVRIKANASNNNSSLQFSNNNATSDWAYISSVAANKMVIRNTIGGNTAAYDAWLHINGGPVHIRDVRGDNGEASDWPVPTLSIQSYDNYFENTMFGMFLRDDNPYTLDFSKWVMRLSGTSGQLTSNSSTNLKFGGPGALQLFTGNTLRSVLNVDGSLSIYNPIYSEASTNPETISFSSVANSMNSAGYNYVINATNNTGTKLVVFVNGSTRSADNGTNSVTVRNDGGALYLGTTASTTFIYNRSDVSDGTMKENIIEYSNGLNLIKSLQPKQFNFIGNERTQYGFVAQDIEDEKVVLPGHDGHPWAIDYNSIISALVSANKELAERVEALENK
jgi:hypothetical protein